MKTISNYFKRISALFLVCITISFSAFSSYASVPVQASGVLEVSIISSLIEALMASMGLSFSSTSDLNNVVTGLDSMMTSNPDYTYKGVKIFEKVTEALHAAKLGATIALPHACIEWFSNWLYGTSKKVLSDSSDVVYRNPSVSVPGVQFVYGNFSKEFFELHKLFYDLPLYLDKTYLFAFTGNEPIFLDSCPMVVSIFNREDNYFTVAYPTTNIITYPKSLDAATVLGTDNALIDSVFQLYTSSGGIGSFKLCAFLHQNTRFKADTCYSKLNSSPYTFNLQFRDCTYDAVLGFQNVYSITNYLPASSTNSEIRVFVNSGTRFYESYEEYAMINMYSAYAPTSVIYGSSSASKELEEDSDAGTVYLQLTKAQLTETIEKAIADALAANPSITEEELNEMVAAQVGALSGVQDSIEEGTSVLSGVMEKVLGTLERIEEFFKSLFVIDTAAIDTALSGFDTVWEEKVPFGGAITDMFDNFSFSEDYDYPVISMKTPDILKSFYAEDLIILCDFANYAVYCVWARNLVRALLWFSFGFSVVNHLKTDFHVG